MSENPSKLELSPAFHALSGGGTMGALVRAYPWDQTALGPISSWPQSLLTSVSICLKSRFPMLIWWGPDLTMIYNDAYIPVPGAKHPRCLGRKGKEVWPEVWDIIGPMLEGVFQRGEATWSEEIMLPLDRKGFPEECYFTFSYSPIHDETGGVGGIFTAVSEVTGKVIGERRLHLLRELSERTADAQSAEEASALVAQVLEGAPADVPFARLYLLGAEGKTARLLGSAGRNLEPQGLPDVIELSQGASEDPWHLARVLQSGQEEVLAGPGTGSEPRPGAWALPVGQDGTRGVLIAGISPRSEFDANYRGFFQLLASTVTTAISKAHAYEAARKRAEALAELDRAKTAFFSNVSHELRTPLTLMLGPLAELLARASELGLPGAEQEQLALAHRNAGRLLTLVNALLDFSRIEAGRMKARFRPTALGPFTASLASVFRSAFEAAGLTLTVDTPELGVPVYVDPEMWEKIVFNLLSNAFKFTLRGGITVKLSRHGDTVRLTVQDTGTGIPEAELSRIFERFHRVEGAESRTHEGTGIGLSLTQELVKLHGGTLEVRSQWGAGSEFQVELPLGRSHLPADQVFEGHATPAPGWLGQAFVEEASRWLPEGALPSAVRILPAPALPPVTRLEPGSEASAVGPERRARVLLADDNADMRAYVHHLLNETCEVEAVADGLAALQSARARPPDLILADVMMPRLDGFGLLKALRAEAATRTLPIILVSARAGEEARIEGLDAGADDYLVKPFSARELVARVSVNLATSRLRRETQVQLEDLLARAKQAIDARDEFLSIASHELKTPLTSLKLQLQQIRRRIDPKQPQAPEPARLAKMLENSSRQLDRLTRLIEDLLDVARIRAGKLSPSFEEFRPEELLSEVLEWFSDQLAEAGCRIDVKLEPGLTVRWDRSRMEQVLVNLLSNAIKYAPGAPIQVRLHGEGAQVRIVVRDFGPGIAHDRQAKIFERFERATSARNISGLGLGLFIASEIVAVHQGTLRVESDEGQGAAFIVQLPLRPEAAPLN